jgi:hypothetical protein
MSRMLKKAASGEGVTLMKMSGTGEVFFADSAQDIHLLYLENDAITVNGANLLAFDAGIDWDIKKVEGVSGMMGGGLFNTALTGTGWESIISDGPPYVRRPAGGHHLGVELEDGRQDRHQAEELHRPRLGRVRPDVVRRAGLGAGAAERGTHLRQPGRRLRRRSARKSGRLITARSRARGRALNVSVRPASSSRGAPLRLLHFLKS